jgi:hypothetical protein
MKEGFESTFSILFYPQIHSIQRNEKENDWKRRAIKTSDRQRKKKKSIFKIFISRISSSTFPNSIAGTTDGTIINGLGLGRPASRAATRRNWMASWGSAWLAVERGGSSGGLTGVVAGEMCVGNHQRRGSWGMWSWDLEVSTRLGFFILFFYFPSFIFFQGKKSFVSFDFFTKYHHYCPSFFTIFITNFSKASLQICQISNRQFSTNRQN